MDIRLFATELVKRAMCKVDDIELLISFTKSVSYQINNELIKPDLALGHVSIGIRVLKDGKMGMSAITSLDIDEALVAVERALSGLAPSPIARFADLNSIKCIDNHDSRIIDAFSNPSVLRDIAQGIRDSFLSEASSEILEGSVGISYGERLFATSSGAAFSRHTCFKVFVEVDSIDFDYVISNKWPDSIEDIKGIALQLYRSMPKEQVTPEELGVAGRELMVVFHPECFEDMLRAILAKKLYASSKASGISDLNVGERIAFSGFTLVDTAINPLLLASSPTDDEGTASQENIVIGNGIFRTFLYDNAAALQAGTKSTGNGLRTPYLAESAAEGPIREGLRGLLVSAGKKPLPVIFKEIGKGIYVKSLLGLHGTDNATFVCGVSSGYSIEKGIISRVLKPGAWNISASILDFDGRKGILREIMLSREVLNTGTAILPWVVARLCF